MDTLSIIIFFVAIVVGIIIGKYITERVKWSDKKKIIEEKWKSQFVELENQTKMELKEIDHKWQLKYTTELSEIKEMFQRAEKWMRQDAIRRSRRTLLGKLWEQVSPYLKNFPYHPSDVKFLGAPIDFVVFDGMGENNIKKVVFLEVKSGKSALNPQEAKLKHVIKSGNVSWQQFNIDKPEEVIREESEEKERISECVEPHIIYEHIDQKIQSAKHTDIKEIQDDNWECEYCGKSFETKEETEEHERTCKEKADTDSTKVQHIIVNEFYNCKYCGKEFKKIHDRDKHQNSCMGNLRKKDDLWD